MITIRDPGLPESDCLRCRTRRKSYHSPSNYPKHFLLLPLVNQRPGSRETRLPAVVLIYDPNGRGDQ